MRLGPSLVLVLLCGCSDSHVADLDSAALDDAVANVDSGARDDAGTGTSCPARADTRRAAVSIAPMDPAVDDCTATHAEGVSLLGAHAASTDDGIVLELDLCPAAGHRCRCDVTVTTVGNDVAAQIAAERDLVLDLQTVPPMFDISDYVMLTRPTTCDCASCGCSQPIAIAAGRAFDAPVVQAVVQLGPGRTICEEVPCDYGGLSLLRVTTPSGSVELAGHETTRLGGAFVRATSDVSNQAVCSSGPGNQPSGSWAMWSAP